MSLDSNTPVDPRVQIELEKLNTATDNINKYEVEIDDAKCEFKKLLAESVIKIKQSAHKLSNSIQAAKPYYESRLYATQLNKETQLAASNYEKAKSIHSAAKEMVYLAEQGLGEKSTLDTACQEMLSHAASRVNQSQLDCSETKNMLKICELKQEVANNRVLKLQTQLKAAIKASRPYYETRANYNGILKAQKHKIANLEGKVSEAKMTYNEALKNLEQISEEIHKMRKDRIRYENLERNNSVEKPYNHFPNTIESTDEYLEIPSKLSIKSSPIRQRIDQHECPHLLYDFESTLTFSTSDVMRRSHSTTSESLYSTVVSMEPSSSAIVTDDIEQWTEIRLSNSESSSSGYSHHSAPVDDHTTGSENSSSDDNRKVVTCTAVYTMPDDENDKKKRNSDNAGGGITTWISRSSSMNKNSSRRQSFDLLIDAGDKVKDVFTSSIQKVGKSLERRNSESEINNENNDFFSFSSRSDKDVLSDEQVLNLQLNDDENI